MKRLLFILFLLLPLIIAAQAPIWRNSWSTNQAPPVIGTNLGVSNTASGFMWKFYAWPDSNTVARLGDVSNIVGSSSAAITNAVASVWTNGVAVVASGATNIEFVGTGWAASNAPAGQIGNVRVWNTAFGDYILKSNGFGTNLTLLGDRFSMSTTGLVYTNFAGFYPRVGISTNFPQAILHINAEYPSMCALIVNSNKYNGLTPSLIITNGRVGIGRHDPRREFEVRGNTAVSGSGTYSNGLGIEGGFICISGLTNWGPANFSNTLAGQYDTAIAVNTNAATGIAVVQIAGGILGPGITATNQYVLLYTNPIYGKGFAVETNGKVTASSIAGVSGSSITVTTNGSDYIATTNLYFIGQSKITNASGDVSIDITPGAATGAFIANQDGVGTNTILGGAGWTNRLVVTTNQITFTNDGYGTYMRWLSSFGTMKLSGALQASALASDTLLIVTQAGIFYGPVYATGFTNTSAAAIFTDVTPSKIAVFGPDRDLTNSTIDAADLAKIGTTNFPMIRVTNMADVGLGLLLRSNALPAPADVGNNRGMSLAVSNKIVGGATPNISELWFMYSTNGTGLHVPMRQDFGSTRFDKLAVLSGGTEASNTFQFWQLDTTNRFFFRNGQSGSLYIRPQVATNDGAGGYGGLMDIALRTDVTNNPTIYYPSIVGAITNNIVGTDLFTVTNASTAKGMVISANGSIGISGAITAGGNITTPSSITSSGGAIYVGSAGLSQWIGNSGGSRMYTPTNGTEVFLDATASSYSSVTTNGTTLLLNPVFQLPLPSASKLTMTNNQIGFANTNGTFVIITSTNGTNLLTPFSIQASNGTINVIGPVLSTSTSSNSPVNNELVQAQWVRSLLSGSGVLYYGTTNITTATNIGGFPSFVYAYSTDIPYPGSRTYTGVTNSQYIGAIVTTNTFQAIQGPVVVNAYMGFNTGGGRSVTVHPEIYFSYDRTNWFGDYECANQALSGGSNLYQFVISFPSYTSTSSAGFYVERRFKIGTQNANPDVTFYLGTNTPSSISFAGPSSVSGNAYLGGNNTWTGSNIFTLPILGDGSLLTNVPFVISSNGVNFINATNLNFHGFGQITNTSGRVDVGIANNSSSPGQILTATATGQAWSNAPAGSTGNLTVIATNQLGTNMAGDFSATGIYVVTATNDLYFYGTNMAAGAQVTFDLTAGTTNRTMTFDTNIVWLGTPAPTLLSSNHVAWVRFISTGTTEASIRAFYAPQIP